MSRYQRLERATDDGLRAPSEPPRDVGRRSLTAGFARKSAPEAGLDMVAGEGPIRLPEGLAAAGVAGPGARLPHLDAIQRAFGPHDVRGVRAHVGGVAEQAADELGALGYATGDDVAFAQEPDLFLAAHEAAH